MNRFKLNAYDDGKEISYWVEFDEVKVTRATRNHWCAQYEMKELNRFYEAGYKQAVCDMEKTNGQ